LTENADTKLKTRVYRQRLNNHESTIVVREDMRGAHAKQRAISIKMSAQSSRYG